MLRGDYPCTHPMLAKETSEERQVTLRTLLVHVDTHEWASVACLNDQSLSSRETDLRAIVEHIETYNQLRK